MQGICLDIGALSLRTFRKPTFSSMRISTSGSTTDSKKQTNNEFLNSENNSRQKPTINPNFSWTNLPDVNKFNKTPSLSKDYPDIFPFTTFPYFNDSSGKRVKIENIDVRRYVPINTYSSHEDKQAILSHPSIQPVSWSNRNDLFYSDIPLEIFSLSGAIKTRNFGKMFLVSGNDPSTSERVRHLFKCFSGNFYPTSRESVCHSFASLLGEGHHFQPTYMLNFPKNGYSSPFDNEDYFTVRRYVEGVTADTVLAYPDAFSYIPDETLVRLNFLEMFMSVNDPYPDNYIQPLNESIRRGWKLTNIRNRLPSRITSKIQFNDLEDTFNQDPSEFGSFDFRRKHLKDKGEDALFRVFIARSEQTMLRILKLKHYSLELKQSGNDHLSSEQVENVNKRIGDIIVDPTLIEAAVMNIQDLNSILYAYKTYTNAELQTMQNHQRWSLALQKIDPTTPLTYKQLLTTNF